MVSLVAASCGGGTTKVGVDAGGVGGISIFQAPTVKIRGNRRQNSPLSLY